MTSSNRTAAAIEARAKATQAKIARLSKVIAKLKSDGMPITVTAVMRRAGVSRSFLYQNPEARQAIQEAADRLSAANQDSNPPPEELWRQRALNAEAALKVAYQEIRQQREVIGQQLGRIRDLETDLPADATQRLLAANTAQRQEISQLSQEIRILAERLVAARGNLQSKERMIAQLEARLLELPSVRGSTDLQPQRQPEKVNSVRNAPVPDDERKLR